MTDVAVLVVSWNSAAFLRPCLHSVLEEAGSLRVQTVVADNGSSDGSADLVRNEFPQVHLLTLNRNAGFAEANNAAQALADPTARYLLLLNPDTVLTPSCLPTLVAWMDAHPDTAGACGPLLLNGDGTLQPSWGRFPTLTSEWTGRIQRTDHKGRRVPLSLAGLSAQTDAMSCDWLGGACLLVRNQALMKMGGPLLDPQFPLYAEEVDLCQRLHAAGRSVYLVPQAECVHFGGGSSRQVQGQALGLLLTSKVRWFAKHRPRQARLLCAGLTGLAAVKSVLLKGERGRAYRDAWQALRAMDTAMP